MTEQSCQRVVGAVWADMVCSPLGLPSRLGSSLNGKTLLRCTIERLSRAEKLDEVVVYCPSGQGGQVGAMLDGLPIKLLPIDLPVPRHWPMIQAARKAALRCWRGGLAGTCYFDEDCNGAALVAVARQFDADALAIVPAAAGAVDPALVDGMVDLYRKHCQQYGLIFSQAPPGLSSAVVRSDLLETLATTPSVLGAAVSYQPDNPSVDPISRECNLPLEPQLVAHPFRFVADSARGFQLLGQLHSCLDGTDSTLDIETAVNWARQHGEEIVSRWPARIEIELTSQSGRNNTLRPMVDSQHGRAVADVDLVLSRVGQLADEVDDLFVTVGGFGEPLMAQGWDRLVGGLKDSGAFAVCLQTDGLLIDQQAAETIVQLAPDIVVVRLDAPDAELYGQLCGGGGGGGSGGSGGYEQVLGGIDNLVAAMGRAKSFLPLIVPEMIKTHQTVPVMEKFYDQWIKRFGSAVIRGYSDRAGQLPDLAISSMAPPKRVPCRRIWQSMVILADGVVTACDEDFLGKMPVGDITSNTLQEIWQGPTFSRLRQMHVAGTLDDYPLCRACRQWHRP